MSIDIASAVAEAYEKGFSDGMEADSWWKDGVQYVGTSGMTLTEARADISSTWNYLPPKPPEED